MSDLEITTAIACFALVFSLFGFVIGAIYNSKQIEKLNDRIDRELASFNRQLHILNNSVYGNNKSGIPSTKVLEKRINILEANIDTHSTLINQHMDAINKLARHIEYPK